ncbi:MAG: phosphate signaling complex protein PhoU [Gammaproteobacteria bacterium WSBS_2016_MAG_OTU1]
MIEKIPHTNPAYDREMKKLTVLLRDMEESLCAQLADIEAAFTTMDLQQAQTVCRNDSRLNEMEGKALRQGIAVLACYQPVAEDLRRVVGTLYTATEYERIGDYVKNFAKNVASFISHEETLKIFPMLLEMTREVRRQFEKYLQAIAEEDLDKALAVWKDDEKIDRIFRETVHKAAENQSDGDGNSHSLVQAISVASNLERLGDRVKNLVELFYYQKTGRQLQNELDK